jgi:hypothetical protein
MPKRKYPPNSDPAAQELFRLTDPGMFVIGDGEVLWDGEAEAYDVEPQKTSGVPDDEDLEKDDT